MHRSIRFQAAVLGFCSLVALAGPAAAQPEAPGAVQDPDAEARKARILANLKLAIPQLADMNPTMGELKPTEFQDLEQGSFVVQGRPQLFLVSKDDKKLYWLQREPIDVSKSEAEIKVEMDKRAAEEAKASAERMTKLNEAAAKAPYRGKKDASVTIVEFSDFQCPFCARGAATMEEVVKKYPDDVKFVFMHFPLDFHPWAKPAAIATNCAAKQDNDAFWILHDKYFADQKALTPANIIEKSKEYLKGSKIDIAAWSTCAEDKNSAEYKAESAKVDEEMKLGQSLGVQGTPGFFVNGKFIKGAQPAAAFDQPIAEAKAASKS